MQHLFENWRQYIGESVVKGRALERYASVLTRETMKVVKDPELIKHLDANSSADVKLNTQIAVDLLDELAWVRDVILHIRQDEKLGTGDGDVLTHGSYEYTLDAPEEERKTSDIHVSIILPYEYDSVVYSKLVPDLKGTFRHELEHSSQPTEMLDVVRKKIPDADVWKTIERADQYYTAEADTKAFVAEIYKKAKTLKISAAEAIDRYLGEVFDTGLSYGHKEEDVMPLIIKIRDWWRHYMASRYPEAEIWDDYWEEED